MAHWAKVVDGKVSQVIVAEQDFIDSGAVGNASEWIQTSYNTRGNVHYNPDTNEPSADQSKALRGNYAGVGYSYDAVNDVFVAPQPFPSWVLNADYLWEAPVARPDDGKHYVWDEPTLAWKEVELA
jgi:hypothetical protein